MPIHCLALAVLQPVFLEVLAGAWSCSQHLGMCVPYFSSLCQLFVHLPPLKCLHLLASFDLLTVTALPGGRGILPSLGREQEEAQRDVRSDFKSYFHIQIRRDTLGGIFPDLVSVYSRPCLPTNPACSTLCGGFVAGDVKVHLPAQKTYLATVCEEVRDQGCAEDQKKRQEGKQPK